MLLCYISKTAIVSATGPVLVIDTKYVYEGMEKSYAQGYLPTVSDGKAKIVLPLLSETVAGTLTATVKLGEPANSPFIFKNYEKQFSKMSFTFDSGTVECYLIEFSLALSATRANGNYPVTISVRGETVNGETFSQEFMLYVHINDGIDPHASKPEPIKTPSSQPKLMVDSYKLDRNFLEAGESATVTVTIRNTSNSQQVKNIKLSFSESSGDILPVGTGAEYRRQIVQGDTYTWSFVVTATATAQSKPHLATIMMEYEDGDGNALSASDRIILHLRQPVRLEYEEPSLPVRLTQGDTPTFAMTLMNLGKSTIYNALLKFEIPGLSTGGSVLVGTILPGSSQTGRTNFRVGSGVLGAVSGKLFLSYEDDYGEYYKKEIPLSTSIEKKMDIAASADAGASSPTSKLPWIVIAAGGAILLAMIYFLISRWLKLKKAREDDEMRL
jgi:hypothetical protein